MQNSQLVSLLLCADVQRFVLRLNIHVPDNLNDHLVLDGALQTVSFAIDLGLIDALDEVSGTVAARASEAK